MGHKVRYNQIAQQETGDKEMPNLDDFHAFKSTSSGGGYGGGGCLGPGVTWVLAIVAILWIIGKLFG